MEIANKIETRLYAEDRLEPGAAVVLGKERLHYLAHVLRLKPGAVVALFNARDGEFSARIEKIAKNAVSLQLGERLRAPGPEGDLWLVFAPIKRGRIDFLAEKATELGASLLQPVMTRLTAVDRVNTARLRANAMEAAEQTGRLSVPQVREAESLTRVIGSWPAERRLYLCVERGRAAPLAKAAAGHVRGAPAAILTGPEGGFHPDELDALVGLPFVTPVSLGQRLLRADTAALAALSVFQSIAGDWPGIDPAGPRY